MNNNFRTWMLPEGVVEALPEEAEKLNALTNIALQTFSSWGYQPLRPPIMEYASTFVGEGQNNNLVDQTIQFKDQKSGKQLGFRADMTPQIARIDAHYLRTDKISRYAYAGEVVRSYPTGHGSARNPTVVGAELLGSASQQADVEIVGLMIAFLKKLSLPKLTIELGNIDIVVELLRHAGIEENQFPQFFDSLVIKDKERLLRLCERNQLPAIYGKLLVEMTNLYGSEDTLAQAKACFADYPSVLHEINRLADIANALKKQHSDVCIHIDLSDVYGYGYHNGLIFSAYVDGVWKSIARGGRYDSFGNHFSEQYRLRRSTGFSCDLNLISPLWDKLSGNARVILCDLNDNSQALRQFIEKLRHDGDSVIQQFDDAIAPNRGCAYCIEKSDAGYRVVECEL